MNENNKTIILSESNALQAYGSPEEVDEITDRLMMLHPEAQAVGIEGMRAVAQLAILSGANPLPSAGEIWVWPGRDGRPIVDIGVAYYRRIGNTKDTVAWVDGNEPRSMTEGERTRYNMSDRSLTGICRGFRFSKFEKLIEMGIPWEAAQKMISRTGIGEVPIEEMVAQRDYKTKSGYVYKKKGDTMEPPNGRTWQWVAEKRSEKDLYRKLSLVDTTLTDAMHARANNVLKQIEQETSGATGDLYGRTDDAWNDTFFGDEEPDIVDVTPEPEEETEATPPENDSPPADAAEIINGILTAVKPNMTAKATPKQLKLMHSGLSQCFNSDTDKKAVLRELFGQDLKSSKDMTKGQVSAVIDWLDFDEEYQVSRRAYNETQVVLRYCLEKQGQMSLLPDDEPEPAAPGAYDE